MRKSLLFGAMLLIASCTVQKEEEFESPVQHRYHAVAEEPVDAETRVYADSKLRVRWNEGDHISIFERNTYNQEFEFLGDTGDTAGDFDPMESSGYHSSGDIEDGHVYAVYPYDKKNKCDYEGKLTVAFPSVQHYKKDSFGVGANVMVAKTNTLDLRFMHVGGYRTFKLYGEGVSVSSVRIESNGPEYLSGRTDVVIGSDDNLAVSFVESSSNSKSVELVCDTPVALGATDADAVEFWFVLPPGTLSQGFTVTVTDENGNEFTKSTSNSIEIKSGVKKSMPAFEVEMGNGPDIPSTINGYSYVDIGLRKSHFDSRITPGSDYDRKIVFATRNIGADSPEDFGYYFRWGELDGWKIIIDTDNGYSYAGQFANDILSATQYDKDGNDLGTTWDANTFAFYGPTSYALLGRLDLESFKGKTDLMCNGTVYGDAATAQWGYPWVTPDTDFLKSFLKFSNGEVQLSNGTKTISVGNSNTTLSLMVSFVEQNGVHGLLFENQESSTSVFIPAGGRCIDSHLCFSESYNDQGNIMSSSTYDNNCGDSVLFDFSELYLMSGATAVASSVRPIAELTLSDEIPAPITLPCIETPEIQSIDYRSATVKSSLTSNGNAMTIRGVCYGTSLSSMTTKRTSGYDTGDFSINLYGLSPGTTYYVKAYATNEAGSVESDVISFTTTATYGTLNGHEWVDIGIRKSMYDLHIEPGSSADRRIVFAKQNIGASREADNGYFFRGNELYGWEYSGSTISYTSISMGNLSQKDKDGNVLKSWTAEDYFTWDENLFYSEGFEIRYEIGDAINYYYGEGWSFIPYALARQLSCSTSHYETLPTTATGTCISLTGLSLDFTFNSNGRNSLTITNPGLGTSVFLPGGYLDGWGESHYHPGSGYCYWVEGDIETHYGGASKHGIKILVDSFGENWDSEYEDYTSWKYGWIANGLVGADCYEGHHLRAIAELPL